MNLPEAAPTPDPDAPAFTVASNAKGETIAAQVRQLAVDVDVRAKDEIDHADLATPTFTKAWEIAERVVTAIVDRLRVDRGQYFTGPSHTPPQLVGKARLVNVDTGSLVPGAWPPNNISIVMQDEETVGLADIEDAARRVAEGDFATVADLLLADAREEISRQRVFEEGKRATFDTTRAVLLAALAAETKIKTTMVSRCSPDSRPLVEIIIDRPRNIGHLTHEPMKAATGRSLHEDEPRTYEALVAKDVGLFWLRNRIAHTLRVPTTGEATVAVFAAVDLFAWLASIPAPTP